MSLHSLGSSWSSQVVTPIQVDRQGAQAKVRGGKGVERQVVFVHGPVRHEVRKGGHAGQCGDGVEACHAVAALAEWRRISPPSD